VLSDSIFPIDTSVKRRSVTTDRGWVVASGEGVDCSDEMVEHEESNA
jgi:hypothetical protein